MLPLDGGDEPTVVAGGPGTLEAGQFSPDGRWVAYASDHGGSQQVYVQPFPASGATRQISLTGGSMPRWHPDGTELFYRAADGMLMAVPVVTSEAAPSGSPFLPGDARALFPVPEGIGSQRSRTYSVSADGRRFLVNRPVALASSRITVVLNWQSEIGE